MQDLIAELYEYCEKYSTPSSTLADEIERATHLHTLAPRMLSGRLQGGLLSMLSRLKRPENILEIGTFTGYSAIHLAEGLTQKGSLITIEIDEEVAELAASFFKKSSFSDKITLLTGDAKELIPHLDMPFDLVFIDADKESYNVYYEMVLPKCRPGALIIVDNVLWSGKVLEDIKDRKTASIHEFNAMVRSDERVSNVLLPFRDGIQLITINEECS
jgi:predicted O-methyltransferase YrrM